MRAERALTSTNGVLIIRFKKIRPAQYKKKGEKTKTRPLWSKMQ